MLISNRDGFHTSVLNALVGDVVMFPNLLSYTWYDMKRYIQNPYTSSWLHIQCCVKYVIYLFTLRIGHTYKSNKSGILFIGILETAIKIYV